MRKRKEEEKKKKNKVSFVAFIDGRQKSLFSK